MWNVLARQLAQALAREAQVDCSKGPPRDIHDRTRQRLVQGCVSVTETGNSGAVTQSLPEGASKCQAAVLGGVVIIDLKIPLAAKLEVESAVADESAEQVVEKTDPGLDVRRAFSVQLERDVDFGLVGLAVDRGFAGTYVSSSKGGLSSWTELHGQIVIVD